MQTGRMGGRMRAFNALLKAWLAQHEARCGIAVWRTDDLEYSVGLHDDLGRMVATGRGPALDEAVQAVRLDCERKGIEL